MVISHGRSSCSPQSLPFSGLNTPSSHPGSLAEVLQPLSIPTAPFDPTPAAPRLAPELITALLKGLRQSRQGPVFILGAAPTRVQDFALDLAEPLVVCRGQLLQPVQVPLDCTPSLQHMDCPTQLRVTPKPADVALNPAVHDAEKGTG